MRCISILCTVFLLCGPALPREPRPGPAAPNQFEIGRYTFLDCDPVGYYEVFIVRPTADGSSIERITLTPARDECVQPAELETASGLINEPVTALLGSTNPCTISQKELQGELKRRGHQLVFSFADVVMRVQCGAQPRLLHSSILDRDMFDAAPNTPERTSWTMRLLQRLDAAVGPGVMDKPIFPILAGEEPPSKGPDSETLRALSGGEYDALFQNEEFKLSDIYRATQNRPPSPSVRLVSIVPPQLAGFGLPEYPPLARLARIEGVVQFRVAIDTNGTPTDPIFVSGHPILREAVKRAVSGWKFPPATTPYEVQATMEFALNCPKAPQKR